MKNNLYILKAQFQILFRKSVNEDRSALFPLSIYFSFNSRIQFDPVSVDITNIDTIFKYTDTRSNQYLNGANVQYHGFNLAKYIFTRLFPIVCNYLKNHFSRFCDDIWRDDITLINGFSGESLNWNWKKQKIETLGGRISFDGKKKREKFLDSTGTKRRKYSRTSSSG